MNDTKIARFVSAALPYVNAAPHVGYAFELVLADAVARQDRLSGYDAKLVTGTDENSLKNVRAARQSGLLPADFVAEKSSRFRRLSSALGVRLDGFVRTSEDARHRQAVHAIWQRCLARGDIEKRRYRGLYCAACEQFYHERELSGGTCPVHGAVPEVVEEENYFFRLSRYQERLEALLSSGALRITPDERQHEAERFVASGLADFSISRSRERAGGFGVPVPGDPTQVVYVWFDALVGYLSALGYPERGEDFERHWRSAERRLHVIGKDILRFHAVYWPAILLSAGEPPPTHLLVHGFVRVNGQKLSKSSAHVVDPVPLVERYGADAVRWFLARHLHTTEDAEYSETELNQAYQSELAHQYGNLLSRVLALAIKHRAGVVRSGAPSSTELALLEQSRSARAAAAHSFAALNVRDAARAVWSLVHAANRYVDACAPWQLAKEEDSGRRGTVLYAALSVIREIAELSSPFLPDTSQRVQSLVRASSSGGAFIVDAAGALPHLFPRDLSPSTRRESS